MQIKTVPSPDNAAMTRAVLVPSNIVAVFRVRKKLRGSVTEDDMNEAGPKRIGAVVDKVCLDLADAIIDRWRAGANG